VPSSLPRSGLPRPAYDRTVAALRECAIRIDAGSSELDEGLRALRAVMAMFTSDPNLADSGVNRALAGIHAALHDVRQGARPSVFPVSGRGRPTNLYADEMRGLLAAALDLLKVHGRMPVAAASAWLARELKEAGVRDEAGRPIPARRLQTWREEASAGVGPEASRERLWELRGRYRQMPWDSLTAEDRRAAAQARAHSIVTLVRDYGPASAPAARGSAHRRES
jgi:hypothetical protein